MNTNFNKKNLLVLLLNMKKIYKSYNKTKIKKPETGRRFAVGDIHGCYKTFKKLVEKKIELTKEDQLFLLGDYIDKGPGSKNVVDYIIDLLISGYRVYPLRGNHEDTKLQTEKNDPDILSWEFRKAKDMLKNGKIKKKYKSFFKSLPYYYELDNFFLVHASFNYKNDKPFEDKVAMLWQRRFKTKKKYIGNKTIIHGHQPVDIDIIKFRVKTKKRVIGLDSGVNYIKKHKIYDFEKMGRLCALDLDSYRLYVKKNIENK